MASSRSECRQPLVPVCGWRAKYGYESMYMIRKGQVRWLAKGDVAGQVKFIHQVYGIAA